MWPPSSGLQETTAPCSPKASVNGMGGPAVGSILTARLGSVTSQATVLPDEQFVHRCQVVARAHRRPAGTGDVVAGSPTPGCSGPGTVRVGAVRPVVVHPQVVGGQ